jgi:hypothetical protein
MELIGSGQDQGAMADSGSTFRFGPMEQALAALFGVAPAKMTAFHGRLQFLQVRGLPLGVRAGRGQKIEYTREQGLQFLLALFLEQHGVDPKTCVWLIQRWWKEIGRWMRLATDAEALAEDNPNPVFMTATLKLMGLGSDHADQVSRIGYFRRFNLDMKVDAQGRPSRREGRAYPREEVRIVLDRLEETEPPYTDQAPWVLVVALTNLVHAFDLALTKAMDRKSDVSKARSTGQGAAGGARRRVRKGK